VISHLVERDECVRDLRPGQEHDPPRGHDLDPAVCLDAGDICEHVRRRGLVRELLRVHERDS
jgi:hypothetical protein